MNSYTKPNVYLPISLHDARVSEFQIVPASINKQDGMIIFIFENGFKITSDAEVYQTGRAIVKFSGIDFDFSHVYYCKESHKREISFEELAKEIKNNSFDVLDESYGYNLSKLVGNMTTQDNWHDVEIEIYHFNETIYEWEDCPK